MHRFTDSLGDEWTFAITVATALRIKQVHGLDLLRFEEWTRQLAEDQYLLCMVLFECVTVEQRNQRGISDVTAFLERLDGDAFERATSTWMEAITDFFPKRLRQLSGPMLQTVERKLADAQHELDKLEQSGELQAQLDAIVDQILGPRSGGPPAPSESTPEP